MLVIVAALWVCAFVVMFACMAREVTGLTRVVRVNVRTLPQSYVTHPVSLCHHVFADEDPVVFNPSSQDKRVGGVGVMEGGGRGGGGGGQRQESGWRFEDDTPHVPAAAKNKAFPTGGRKRI